MTTALMVKGTAQGVRDALLVLTEGPLRHLPDGERSATQIVLAEVLNNIVEHARADLIDLNLWSEEGGTRFVIRDQGDEMPEGELPVGQPPQPGTLPEGGFGWFLIRSFVQDLAYVRTDGRNELSFLLPSP